MGFPYCMDVFFKCVGKPNINKQKGLDTSAKVFEA